MDYQALLECVEKMEETAPVKEPRETKEPKDWMEYLDPRYRTRSPRSSTCSLYSVS